MNIAGGEMLMRVGTRAAFTRTVVTAGAASSEA